MALTLNLGKSAQRVKNRRGQTLHSGQFYSVRGAIQDAVTQGKSLRGADLRGQNMSRMDLRGAILSHSDLREVDLFAAQLEGASFQRSNLKYVTLRFDAVFSPGALTDAINLNLVKIVDRDGRRIPGARLTLEGIQLPASFDPAVGVIERSKTPAAAAAAAPAAPAAPVAPKPELVATVSAEAPAAAATIAAKPARRRRIDSAGPLERALHALEA